MVQITLTTETYQKKPLTKTTYKLVETETEVISEQQYKNIVDSASYFRRLGGSVYQDRNYTNAGYKVTKDISTSPDKSRKTVRKFNFKFIG
jgi:hypothetical protein